MKKCKTVNYFRANLNEIHQNLFILCVNSSIFWDIQPYDKSFNVGERTVLWTSFFSSQFLLIHSIKTFLIFSPLHQNLNIYYISYFISFANPDFRYFIKFCFQTIMNFWCFIFELKLICFQSKNFHVKFCEVEIFWFALLNANALENK